METFLFWFFFVVIMIGGLIAWAFWYDSNAKIKAERKKMDEEYQKRYQALINSRSKHAQSMAYLSHIGFHNDRLNKIGDKHFCFDYTKKLASYEEFHLYEEILTCTKKDSYRIHAIPISLCSDLAVFPYEKIVECTLLQDGAVVKSSEGSAALAGSQLAIFGALQGTASSKSGEHQTGILSVRLTIDDIQIPSLLFNFTGGGVEKSSEAYAQAFQQAQQVFGIFDAIVRINLKNRGASSQSAPNTAAPSSQPAAVPSPSHQDDVFEKIRQLGKLKEEGLLTQQEFEAKKKVLMDQIQ